MLPLLDECCGKSLVLVAERLGHTAHRTVAIPALGQQASDSDIVSFAFGSRRGNRHDKSRGLYHFGSAQLSSSGRNSLAVGGHSTDASAFCKSIDGSIVLFRSNQ